MRKLKMEELGRKSVSEFRLAEKLPVWIVLENIRSMHNVGSVFRTADAFLMEGISLCGYTPKPPHRDIHKTALGATETVNWDAFDHAQACLLHLKESGYRLLAVEQVDESIPLDRLECSPDQKIALVFGNEVSGVEPRTLAICEGSIEIPQLGMKHSLNISVAAGIVMWEFFRKMKGNGKN